jgi:hypothetical protein
MTKSKDYMEEWDSMHNASDDGDQYFMKLTQDGSHKQGTLSIRMHCLLPGWLCNT